jgi:hypothetical protein
VCIASTGEYSFNTGLVRTRLPPSGLSPFRSPLVRLVWRTRAGEWQHGGWVDGNQAQSLKALAERNNKRPGNHVRYAVQSHS